MSYIFNNQISYSDSPNLDAFGRLRTAAVTNLLDIKHVYDKLPLLVNELTAGTATSVFSQEYARVRMSAGTTGDYVIRQTKTHPVYQPGKSQLFEGSFSNFQLESGVIKRVGSFGSTTASTYDTQLDGFFLESDGITNKISFNIYRTGTLVYSSDTSSWNTNQVNPNTISWSATNLMVTDYQWLGVGRMRFGLNLSGETYYFAEHNCANNENSVYMSSPNQPIRYEIRSSGGTGYFDMICSQTSTEGALNGLYNTLGIAHTGVTSLLQDTKHPYIGVRLKPEYRGVVSQISDCTIVNATSGAKRDFMVTIDFNPSLNYTPTWVDVNNSPFQYSLITANTQTVTGNTEYTLSTFVGGADQSVPNSLAFDDNQVKIGVNVNGNKDEMWMCITPLGNSASFRGSLNLRYYI